MLSDLRFAVRSLLKAPLFTIVVIATIALGIAANTAIFSVVHAVLLAPPPFSEPERLAVVWETDRNTGTTREPGSWPDFQDIQRQSRTMAAMGGFIADEMNLSPGQGDPRRVPVLHASHELIPLLGIQPIAGRVFTPAEDAKSGPAVALISDALWQREFRRDPGAIGRTLRLDDTPWTIVGVMPPEADFGILQVLTSAAYGRAFADRGERAQVDIWLPLQGDAAQLPRSTHPLLMIGRLAPAATIGAAQAEIGAIAANLEKSFPDNAARGYERRVADARDLRTGTARAVRPACHRRARADRRLRQRCQPAARPRRHARARSGRSPGAWSRQRDAAAALRHRKCGAHGNRQRNRRRARLPRCPRDRRARSGRCATPRRGGGRSFRAGGHRGRVHRCCLSVRHHPLDSPASGSRHRIR